MAKFKLLTRPRLRSERSGWHQPDRPDGSGSETGFPDSGPRESSQLRDRVQGRVGASARLQVLPRDQEIVARKTPDEQN